MMKQFNFFLIRYFNIIYHSSVFVKYLVNILGIFFIGFSVVYIYNLNNIGLIAFCITFFIPLLFSKYIYNILSGKGKKIINFLRKFVIFIFILYLGLDFFDINLFDTIHCDSDDEDEDEDGDNKNKKDNKKENKKDKNNDNNNNSNNVFNINKSTDDKNESSYEFSGSIKEKTLEKIGEYGAKLSEYKGEDVVDSLVIGRVGSKAVETAIKSTQGMPILPRAAAVASLTGAAVSGTYLGLKSIKAVTSNNDVKEEISNNISDSIPSPDSTPSPTTDFINSILESGDNNIPLVDLLNVLFSLNILELILIILLILILFDKFITKININNNLLFKLLKKINVRKIESLENIYQKFIKYNDKFLNIMIIITLFILILLKLLNLYVSGELYYNADDYVLVYNYLKNINNKFILLFICSKLNINKNYIINNSNSINNNGKNRFISSDNKIIKPLDYINLNLDTKINKFGSYENYLIQLSKDNAITEEFINEYYPNLKNDDLFILYLNELNPVIRTEVKYVLDLYEFIVKFNSFKDKIVLLNEYLNEDLLLNIMKEYKDCRKEIINILRELGYNDNYLDKLLFNLNKKIRNQILLEKSVLISDKLSSIQNDKLYLNTWNFIKNLIEKDLDHEIYNNSEKIKDMEDIFTKIYCLILFIEENKISFSSSKEQFLEKYKNEFIIFCKREKTETYRTNKGQTRTKKMREGLIINGYKDILIEMKNKLESIILSLFNENYYSKANMENLIENNEVLSEKILNIDTTIQKDFYHIYNKVYKAFDLNQFVVEFSKNLSDKNINFQYNKLINYFQDFFKENNTKHDDLISIYNLINKYNNKYIRINELSLTRENSLTSNSYLYLRCREIINQNISSDKKQLLLENFILNFEKEFTLNIIKNMNNNVNDYKLLTRIYKHSTSQFSERIKVFVENNKKRNYESYLKNKNNMNKLSDHLALALFITVEAEQLVNIIFSKVVRFIGLSGGITQNELLVNLSDEMLVTFKYNLNNNKILNKLTSEEINIVNDVKDRLIDLPFEVKYKFGDLLLELILDEFNYIFDKNNIYENNEHYIYITIKPEYLAILSGSIFNPIKIPMVSKPKEWLYNNLEKIEQIGGYYLEEFNELSKDNSIIRQNTINKFESLVSIDQINTINYLNSIPFEINKNMLEFIVKEWNDLNNSSLFKGINKLHPLTNNFDKQTNSIKKEILSHNSKHWTFTNIINIALLMKDQTIYFPTFLDFRGRIYPTPNYLSYQSTDLARSLLLFKNISSDIKNEENIYYQTITNIMKDELYANKNIKTKNLNIKEIDYFKLYLANTFGKNRLSRDGRIKWVENNINDIFNAFESNLEVLKSNYLLESKEPFQFLACIICYYNYIKFNRDIKIPILFDASCSGIQHLSALTTDIKISKLVNLFDNEEPSDFYQYCIDQILEITKNLPEEYKHKNLKNKLLQLNIHRKWLKHSIMTIPYNVTSIGISDKLIKYFDLIFIDKDNLNKLEKGEIQLKIIIEENLNIKKEEIKIRKEKLIGLYIPKKEIIKTNTDNNLYFTQSEIIAFSQIIKTTVLNIIPPFNELKIYFDKIIDILKKLDLPLFWNTPSGMTVSMSNRKMKSKQIKTSLIKKAKPISILIPTEQIDYKNIKTGLMPNFIHSLDASNIHILIKNILLLNKPNINLYTIHDCFASDYKNIALIELLVKHSFVELYFRKNYLETVHNSFILQIKSQIEIFEESIVIDGNAVKNKYLLIPKKENFKNQLEKINIPNLPNYNWQIKKETIYNELLFNSYFIS